MGRRQMCQVLKVASATFYLFCFGISSLRGSMCAMSASAQRSTLSLRLYLKFEGLPCTCRCPLLGVPPMCTDRGSAPLASKEDATPATTVLKRSLSVLAIRIEVYQSTPQNSPLEGQTKYVRLDTKAWVHGSGCHGSSLEDLRVGW